MQKYTNNNDVLLKIIELVINNHTESGVILPDINVPENNQRFYVNKNVNLVNHLSSETFYTREYVEQIKNLLGNYNDFLSLPAYNRKLIQSELDLLSHDDFILKTYLHKSVYESKNLHKLFPASFDKFKRNWENLRNGTESQRGYRLSFRYEYKSFYNKIIDLLIEKKYEISYLNNITDQDLDTVFQNYLTPDVLYDAFCVILLKTARDSLFSNTNNQFNDVSMTVLRHQVIYHIYATWYLFVYRTQSPTKSLF